MIRRDPTDGLPLRKYVRLEEEANNEDLIVLNDDAEDRFSFEDDSDDSDRGDEQNETTFDSFGESDVDVFEIDDPPQNPKKARAGRHEEVAAAASTPSSASYNVKLVSHVMEMFPDACPIYVRRLCDGKKMTDAFVDEVIQIFFSSKFFVVECYVFFYR